MDSPRWLRRRRRSCPISTIEVAAGFSLIALVLYDVFETIVVPRRTEARWRISPLIVFLLWPLWQKVGVRIRPSWRREDFLGAYAPFVIMLILVVWVLMLITGFGMVFHALADELTPKPSGHFEAFYAAGTALLTIGYGDIVPTGPVARVISILAGGAGLAIVAMVIALNFNLYNSFSQREVLVLLLGPRAGTPPSGVTLLETYGERRIARELTSLFAEYEIWTAQMLESHLAYPVLVFFRASHDNHSWVSTLGAVLDAATLLLALTEEPADDASDDVLVSRAAAEMMYRTGCHALLDLTQFRRVRDRAAHLAKTPGIERAEFDAACEQLAAAGYLVSSTDKSWEEFARRRSVYALRLNALARFLASPPTQWIGDRSTLSFGQEPHLH